MLSFRRKASSGRSAQLGLRHGTDAPSAIAASRPERSPSSWKPCPVHAPAKEVWRTPWISSRRACADSARASNCGCAEAPFAEHQVRARLDHRIERNEQRQAIVDALQPVHPVGHADIAVVALPVVARAQIVPGRPGGAPLRHQARVAMQDDAVRPVGDCRQDLPLGRRGIAEHRQRLVAVRRDDDMVEAFGRPHRPPRW